MDPVEKTRRRRIVKLTLEASAFPNRVFVRDWDFFLSSKFSTRGGFGRPFSHDAQSLKSTNKPKIRRVAGESRRHAVSKYKRFDLGTSLERESICKMNNRTI